MIMKNKEESKMSKLLYLKSSPDDDRSYSTAVADSLVEEYRKLHPEDEVCVKNLFSEDLPPFDGFALKAKYRILHGEDSTNEEKEAWERIENIISEFNSADKYVLAVPMWNFGIPYRLKQYLDIIVQPGYTFSFSPEEGYSGLVKDKPLTAVYARGGAYSEGTGMDAYDFQKKYVDHILGFIGFTNVRSIIVEPTLAGGPEAAAEAKENSIKEAVAVATEI